MGVGGRLRPLVYKGLRQQCDDGAFEIQVLMLLRRGQEAQQIIIIAESRFYCMIALAFLHLYDFRIATEDRHERLI